MKLLEVKLIKVCGAKFIVGDCAPIRLWCELLYGIDEAKSGLILLAELVGEAVWPGDGEEFGKYAVKVCVGKLLAGFVAAKGLGV